MSSLVTLFLTILTAFVQLQLVTGQNPTISAALSPPFLNYNSTLEMTFNLSSSCSTSRLSIVTYSTDDSDSEIATEWCQSEKVSRPDDMTVLFSSINYANSLEYFANCNNKNKATTSYLPSPLPVHIPVSPKILAMRLLDSDKNVMTLVSYYDDEINRQTVWEYSVLFDDVYDRYAQLEVQVGNGVFFNDTTDGNVYGSYTLSGDVADLISDNLDSTKLEMLPTYPDGMIYNYRIDAEKWAAVSAACKATVTATSEISEATAVELDLVHQGSVQIDFNFKPKLLMASSSTTGASCTFTCNVSASCPIAAISMQILLIDADGSTLLGQKSESDLVSRQLSYTVYDSSLCEKFVSLANTDTGTMRCIATNGIGTTATAWSMKDVENLSGLKLVSDSSLDWWIYVIIAIGGLLLILMVAAAIMYSLHSVENRKSQTVPGSTNQPTEAVNKQLSDNSGSLTMYTPGPDSVFTDFPQSVAVASIVNSPQILHTSSAENSFSYPGHFHNGVKIRREIIV